MKKLYNTNNDVSDKFMPIWKQFKMFQTILLFIWGMFLFLVFLNTLIINNSVIGDILNLFLFILFVLTFIFVLYFIHKLRCPKCGKSVYPYGGYYGGGGHGWIYFTGECRYCGAMLKERKISQETEIMLRKRINIIALLISIICIAAVIYYCLIF